MEDEAELDPDYAKDLIDVVIGGMSESDTLGQSIKVSKKTKLNAKRL